MKKFLPAILFFLTISTFAGFNGLTIHSRANCIGINESITWDLTKFRLLITTGLHTVPEIPIWHNLEDQERYTWRSAALCWKEDKAAYPWRAYGTHFMKLPNTDVHNLGYTEARDCNIYEGWWSTNEDD